MTAAQKSKTCRNAVEDCCCITTHDKILEEWKRTLKHIKEITAENFVRNFLLHTNVPNIHASQRDAGCSYLDKKLTKTTDSIGSDVE